MLQYAAFRRSQIQIPDGLFPAITAGRKTWIFSDGGPIVMPTWETRAPQRVLSWLLHGLLQPIPDNTLSVTVTTRLGCNLRCGYCFQNTKFTPGRVDRISNDWMSDEVIAATAAFVHHQRRHQARDDVSLLLFGGEPLIDPGHCYKVLDAIEHNEASIVTNGVYLSTVVAKELALRGVGVVQVTFDGARQDHNNVRIRANGGGTYDEIMLRLIKLDELDVFPERHLRINVTPSNLPRLYELVADLQANLNASRWTLYFSPVQDHDIGWTDVLTPRQSVDLSLAVLARQAAEAGFRVPLPGRAACGYCHESFGDGGIVVSPNGDLASCWETAGFKHMAVGNVWDGYKPRAGNEHLWVPCGYNSMNQRTGPPSPAGQFSEYDWSLFEGTVRAELYRNGT